MSMGTSDSYCAVKPIGPSWLFLWATFLEKKNELDWSIVTLFVS